LLAKIVSCSSEILSKDRDSLAENAVVFYHVFLKLNIRLVVTI